MNTLEDSGRKFPCFVCSKITPLRFGEEPDCPGVPCCSEACSIIIQTPALVSND
jgi:hypothetical protein